MDRLYKPYLRKEGLEREKYYKRREYVYMPTNTDDQPLGNMDILLVADVEGMLMEKSLNSALFHRKHFGEFSR